jgi:hypothetical protein
MDKKILYSLIQEMIEEREKSKIPLTKEGLLVSRKEGDYIIKIIKLKS